MRRLDIETAEKQRKALRLRNLGISYDQIAEELGYAGRSGAWKAVKTALDRAVIEPAQEQRVIQSERLDLMVTRCLQAVLSGDLDQVRNVLAIEKRRADLWGLDGAKSDQTIRVVGAEGGPLQTDVGALLIERLRALSPQALETSPAPVGVPAIEAGAHDGS